MPYARNLRVCSSSNIDDANDLMKFYIEVIRQFVMTVDERKG